MRTSSLDLIVTAWWFSKLVADLAFACGGRFEGVSGGTTTMRSSAAA